MLHHPNQRTIRALDVANAIRTGLCSFPEITDRLKDAGLTDTLRLDLDALIAAVETASNRKIDAWSAVKAARRSVDDAEAAAKALYVQGLDYARACLRRSDPRYDRLGLHGRRKWTSRDGWTAQARRMYQALAETPALQDALLPFVVDPQHGLDTLDALDAALAERQALRESAKQATIDRDAAVQRLKVHVRLIQTLARHTITSPAHRSLLGISRS